MRVSFIDNGPYGRHGLNGLVVFVDKVDGVYKVHWSLNPAASLLKLI